MFANIYLNAIFILQSCTPIRCLFRKLKAKCGIIDRMSLDIKGKYAVRRSANCVFAIYIRRSYVYCSAIALGSLLASLRVCVDYNNEAIIRMIIDFLF
jgi:hypothetical protein